MLHKTSTQYSSDLGNVELRYTKWYLDMFHCGWRVTRVIAKNLETTSIRYWFNTEVPMSIRGSFKPFYRGVRLEKTERSAHLQETWQMAFVDCMYIFLCKTQVGVCYWWFKWFNWQEVITSSSAVLEWTDNNPLPESMMTQLMDAYMQQWDSVT